MIIFSNAYIHTMTQEPFRGSIAVEGSKIVRVAPGPIDDDAEERYDCEGAVITPGFIDAHTHQGLFQGDIGWAGMDGNEMTDPVTPPAGDRCDQSGGSRHTGSGIRRVTVINTGPGAPMCSAGFSAPLKPPAILLRK